MENAVLDAMEAHPSGLPFAMIENTSQMQLFEWTNKFYDLFNHTLHKHKEHFEGLAYRSKVQRFIMETLEKYENRSPIPISGFVIKVMEKTWLLTHPFTTPAAFKAAYQPPVRGEALVHAPPYLVPEVLQGWIDDLGILHGLRQYIVFSLEPPCRARVHEIRIVFSLEDQFRFREHNFPDIHGRVEAQQHADYQKELEERCLTHPSCYEDWDWLESGDV